MIKQEVVERIIDAADIVEVVGEFVKLKRAGVNQTGCCPFHNEKTASFVVSPVKQIYKCFGCGKGGNAVSFIMDHEKLSFPEAIEFLGRKFNIEIERDTVKEDAVIIEVKEGILNANKLALKKFQLTPLELISDRFTKDDIIQWQIGYSPNEGKFLTSPIIELGLYEFAIKCGLVAEKDGQGYDKLRNRIIFPIQNRIGECIGFGARALPGIDEKKYAKYLNSNDSPVYNKSRVLYGLNFAAKEIRVKNNCYLVEGYADVIAMHRNGFINTVASCGTALTEEHCKLLKKYCDTVTILRDGDSAGNKAADKDIEILMRYGFRVQRINLSAEDDPETFFQSFHRISIAAKSALLGFDITYEKYFKSFAFDAILEMISSIYSGAADDIVLKGKAIQKIKSLLSSIPNENIRNAYINDFCKSHKLKTTDFKDSKKKITDEQIDELSEEDEALKRLQPAQKEEYMKFGFFERKDGAKTGYYFRNASGSSFTARTNFVIDPLYHVYGDDNRRMIKVNNGITDEVVIEMKSKDMLSMENFCASLYNEGYFLPKEGFTRDHLLRIHNKVGNSYPRVYEITTLGWQPEGFFAFQNKVYKPATQSEPGVVTEYNEYGIATVGASLFLSPSLSRAQEGLREGENIYENDLYLQHKPSPITFERWSELMVHVYAKNAWMGIAWCIATIMKDQVEKTARVPHINPYGQKGSGKSEFGNSLQFLFFSGKDSFGDLYKPMNLNQGTDFAFFNRYARFSNCPNVLNEFDENGIKDEWFRAIKSSYDGEGREKGKGVKNQTGSQKIRSTTVIIGQYLGTKDDNSVLSRSLPLPFKLEDSRPEEQVLFFRALKKHEDEGLSGLLCQLMDMRDEFTRNFSTIFFEHVKQMQQSLLDEGIHTIDRILKNVCMMVTCIDMASKKFQLPFTVDEFKEYGREFIKNLTRIITKTSKLAEFWKIVESLIDMNVLEEGFDFDIKTGVLDVKILEGSNDVRVHSFAEPTDIIHIRFNAVHSYYEKEFRSRSGQKATNDETIKLYLQEQKYYIGSKKSHKFYSDRLKKETNTSCIVLDLGKMDVNLIRTESVDENRMDVVGLVGVVSKTPTATTTPGVFAFTVKCIDTIKETGAPTKYNEYWVRCFFANISVTNDLKQDTEVRLNGKLAKNYKKGMEFRSMSVESYEVDGNVVTSETRPYDQIKDEDLPF